MTFHVKVNQDQFNLDNKYNSRIVSDINMLRPGIKTAKLHTKF